jgi:hypothetical protein
VLRFRDAAGSALDVDIANNLVRNTVLEAMVFSLHGDIGPNVGQFSFLVRHNTIASRGDTNFGIAFRSVPGFPVTVANNAISYIGHPIDAPSNANSAMLKLIDNLSAKDAASKSWFVDFDAGNFAPSKTSPLIALGSAEFGVPVDIDGKPRTQRWDAGAFQYQP